MGKKKVEKVEDVVEEPGTFKGESKFAVNECVLAFHNANMMYEAKILKRLNKKNEVHYFLHWNGWSKKWDQYVEEEKIIAKTPETVLNMKENNAAIKSANKKGKPVKEKEQKPDKQKQDPKAKAGKKEKGKKRKRDDGGAVSEDDETIDMDTEKPEKHDVKLKIPGQIKKFLITDWEKVTRAKLITKCPATYTISSIFTHYLESKTKNKENHEITHQVMEGIKEYFNKSIGVLLLYRFERPQYTDLQKQISSSEACSVYGAAHLSRLFVKLPELLGHTKMTTQEKTLIQTKLGDFLKWLAKNPKYFTDEYQTTERDYHLRVDVD